MCLCVTTKVILLPMNPCRQLEELRSKSELVTKWSEFKGLGVQRVDKRAKKFSFLNKLKGCGNGFKLVFLSS